MALPAQNFHEHMCYSRAYIQAIAVSLQAAQDTQDPTKRQVFLDSALQLTKDFQEQLLAAGAKLP